MSKLFYANQTKGGSIYITMKRIDNSKKPVPRVGHKPKKSKKVKKRPQKAEIETSPDGPKEYMCLIRVHNNSRKISTIVSCKEVNKFQQVFLTPDWFCHRVDDSVLTHRRIPTCCEATCTG